VCNNRVTNFIRGKGVEPVTSPALCPHGNPPDCPLCAAAGATVHTGEPPSSKTLPPLLVPPLTPAAAEKTIFESRPPAGAESRPPPIIPGYDVVEVLGHGGMGVVYKAWHQRLKRHVALKMLRAGAHASREANLRFRIEAEAVARLQHPNIVQIHEIGDHDGLPFFALEFVAGDTLDHLVEKGPLPPRRAAELVETVARAVGHAHQRGVVHRDLKPSNVLLTADGAPKVADFGLAKRLDDEQRGQTREGAVVGTPSYMAPEQAQGRVHEIGPATDVYALGTILYELLAGAPPFRGATTLETLMQVIHEEPPAPRRLRRGVPRDLEIIALKCLQKDPARRYGTAAELADDLRRWLDGEPIKARPAGVWERAAKWARRRPAAAALLVVSAVAALALLAGGVEYSVRVRAERDRAEANLEMAMRAVDDMLTEVGEEQLAYEPRMEEKRRRLLKKAQAMYQEFLQQKYDSPRIRLQTALASRRVADVDRLLGDYRDADADYDDAIRRFDELHKEDSGNRTYRRHLAACWNYRGEARRHLGDAAGADEAYGEARALYERLVAEDGADADARRDLAQTRMNRGILLTDNGNYAAAGDDFAEAIRLLGDPEGRGDRHYLARAHLNRGRLQHAARDLPAAADSYSKAIRLLAGLRREEPDHPDYRHELGSAQNNLGNLQAEQGTLDLARASHRAAVAEFTSLAADFRKVPVYRQELANSFNSLGKVVASGKDWGGAAAEWARGLEIAEALAKEYPDVPGYSADRARLLGNLGWVATKREDWPTARARFTEALELARPLAENYRDNQDYRKLMRDQSRSLAETCVQLGDHAAAAAAARSLADAIPEAGQDAYFAGCFVARCVPLAGQDASLTGDKREKLAAQYAEEALQFLQEAFRRGFRDAAALKREERGIFKPLAARPEFQALLPK
jgi:tetratricopeptide (TPR) repeat protein/tRNA A-37 threonylcarbamoyl transferase component Bud32